jgi:hypothetical protein
MREARIVIAIGAVLVASCAGAPADGIIGNPTEMRTEAGDHEGYRLEACPDSTESWLVIGTGSNYYRDVAPTDADRQQAVIALRDEILAPIYQTLDSFVFSGGYGLACQAGLPPLASVGIRDWGELDQLIEQVGSALDAGDLAEAVQVEITAPIVPL